MPLPILRWSSSRLPPCDQSPALRQLRFRANVKSSSSLSRLADRSDCALSGSSQQQADSCLHHVDHEYLYADSAPVQPTSTKPPTFKSATTKSRLFREQKTTSVALHRPFNNHASGSNENPEKVASHTHAVVRRVASFTYSGDSNGAKNSKPAGPKKFNFASISKIGNFIRAKVDSANSTSTLYPSREDIRRWQESFENLLHDKHGCHLFRQFVTREVSSENLDFYQDVEDFKKLKAGKKSTVQRAYDIFDTYFIEGAAKELNLDSCTKNSTKAALSAGALPDTFNLAQSRIEQLMAKDSYRRFLQSQPYISLLQSTTPPPVENTSSSLCTSEEQRNSLVKTADLASTRSLETEEKREFLQILHVTKT